MPKYTRALFLVHFAALACGGAIAPNSGDGGNPDPKDTDGSADSPSFAVCPEKPPILGSVCLSPGNGCRFDDAMGCYAAVACIESANGTATWQTANCN
jgi:hypothetical protein